MKFISIEKRMMLVFVFVKHKGLWYVDRPPLAHYGRAAERLSPVPREGLHTLLDQAAMGAGKVYLYTSDQPFEEADELELTQADGEGGYYVLKSLLGKPYVLLLRLFGVQPYFGYLPAKLYIQPDAKTSQVQHG